MLSIVKSMSLHGLDGYLVYVQIDVSAGMPAWEIVGLPDTTIKESKERVRTAIKNSGIEFPSRRIVVNLAPADSRKEGAFFDLPIAIGVLLATENIKCINIEEFAFIGELSLDGKINKTNGILPMCIEVQKLGVKKVVLPLENAKEAAIVKGLEIIPVNKLIDVVNYLNGEKIIEPFKATNIKDIGNNEISLFDFSDVKGQENVKRALEISAAGGHNCLLIGSPGSGKTMLARRLPSILPDLTFEESLEITKIHSIAGIMSSDMSLITKRPFRAPHNTVSGASLIGGGKVPKPRGNKSFALWSTVFRRITRI